MKNLNISLLVIIFSLLNFFYSCNDMEENQPTGKGLLKIQVETDTSIFTRSENRSTKLRLVMIDENGQVIENRPVLEYDFSEIESDEISVDIGRYRVTAIVGNDPDGVPVLTPYYVGSEDIVVVYGENEPVKITCLLTTSVITVDYSNIKEVYERYMEEYETVVSSKSGSIIFGKDDSGKLSYFPQENLSVDFRYKPINENWVENHMDEIDGLEIKPQYKYVITFSLKDEEGESSTGSAGIGISIEHDIDEKETNITIELPKLISVIEDVMIDLEDLSVEINGLCYINNGNSIESVSYQYCLLEDSENSAAWKKIVAAKDGNKWIGKISSNTLQSNKNYKVWIEDNPSDYKIFSTYRMSQSAAGWGKFAFVNAEYEPDLDLTLLKYQYKKTDSSIWLDSSSEVTKEEGKYSSVIKGLDPQSTYDFRLVTKTENIKGNINSFSTDAIKELPNGNFDEWNQRKWTVAWVLNYTAWYAGSQADANARNCFWDSGNEGTATMSASPTSPEESIVHTAGGKSVKLKSQYVGVGGNLGKFAAGNLFVGQFQELDGINGGILNFGREFTARPTQLKGWYNYTSGPVTHSDSDELKVGDEDLCAIYVALTDNEGVANKYGNGKAAYQINNSNYDTMIDYSENNKDIIAYGSLTDTESKSTGGWKQFIIDIKYRDLERIPKYLIIVTSASKYGDYFTGSTSSVMYLDDFELLYDNPPVIE